MNTLTITLRQTSILFKPLTVVTVIIKHTVQNKTTEEKLPALNRGMTLRAVHLCAGLTKGVCICVCVYVCVCIYVCVCVCVCTSLCICDICVCVCVYMCVYMCVCVSASLCICGICDICVCICVFVYVHPCVFVIFVI